LGRDREAGQEELGVGRQLYRFSNSDATDLQAANEPERKVVWAGSAHGATAGRRYVVDRAVKGNGTSTIPPRVIGRATWLRGIAITGFSTGIVVQIGFLG
jgi:hypothetical protein